MEELETSQNHYSIVKNGEVITIKAKNSITIESLCKDEEENLIVIALKNKKENASYKIDYLFLDENFNIVKCVSEKYGVMPYFILAPDKSIWVRLTYTKSIKLKEIVLPMSDRNRVTKEILASEFVSAYKVRSKEDILVYDDLFSSDKEDKLCRFTFDKNGLYKSRKVKKVPLPSHTKIIHSEDSLQGINFDWPKNVLHREFKKTFEVTQSREFHLDEEFDFVYPIHLSFNEDSILFVSKGSKFYEVKVDRNCRVIETKCLVEVDIPEEINRVWRPLLMNKDMYLALFNYASGTGFIVYSRDRLRECWIKQKDSYTYKEIYTGDELEFNLPDYRLYDVIKTSGNKCAMFFDSSISDIIDKEVRIMIKEL